MGALVVALVGFCAVAPFVTAFFGGNAVVRLLALVGAADYFFVGLAGDFLAVVSRETSGISAPRPRPKLCRFAISYPFALRSVISRAAAR